jgi:hypothetical protein
MKKEELKTKKEERGKQRSANRKRYFMRSIIK